jgi:hypothetical protein
VHAYFYGPLRNQSTDQQWLLHQIYKEYCDGVKPYANKLMNSIDNIADKTGRESLKDLAEIVCDEVDHFLMFVELWELLVGEQYSVDPARLARLGSWPENDALIQARQRHRDQSAKIGARAASFSEGGYMALFSEGSRLPAHSDFDKLLAKVCRSIYDDEFQHMLLGIVQTDAQQLSDGEWDLLQVFSVEQMRLRVAMRQAQFGNPVPNDRLQILLEGGGEPVDFDYKSAMAVASRMRGSA